MLCCFVVRQPLCVNCVYTLQVFREIVVNGFDFSGYETKQVFYSSKDGTKVPMFTVHRKVSGPAARLSGAW